MILHFLLEKCKLRMTRFYPFLPTVQVTKKQLLSFQVWVGGTKPGRIEFLGETKFAAGEWAGVVLDEPVGKNDGSVGGVSYFKVTTFLDGYL